MNDKFHAKILHMLMEHELLKDTASLRDFVEGDLLLKTAFIKSTDEKLCLVCNLPTLVPKLFAMVSEGDPEELIRIMAHIEEVDFNKGIISNGHVIRFDDKYLLNANKIGVLILNAQVSPVLSLLPEAIQFEGKTITPYLVVLIDPFEYDLWKNNGNEALMKHFEEIDKDLVAFVP